MMKDVPERCRARTKFDTYVFISSTFFCNMCWAYSST